MPTYKIFPRNSFTVNGRLFFVARTRYMDDGMQVFELKGTEAVRVFGFWECLLLPDHHRKLPCREVARRLVKAWVECKEWVPTPEQRKEAFESDQTSWWTNDGVPYRRWHRHFTPEPAPEPTTT